MASITLADIQAAAERKYGSYFIDLGEQGQVELVNALRLSREDRRALTAMQDRAEGDEKIDSEDMLHETIRLIARDAHQANLLLGAVGGDLAVLAEIMAQYTEGTQAGEASPSQN